jgi:hypothetical protein
MSVPCYIYHSFPLEREKQEKEKGNNPSGKNRKLWIAAWGEASIEQQRRGERDKQVSNDKHVTSRSHPRVRQASLPGKQEKESNR